ncbi:MAG: flagellar hook protein FlgE [Burkholderiales bacterium]
MSFQQGLSGLNAAAKNLDVIGNNVSNASTVGFKSSQAIFADVYASTLSGASGVQVGIGTKLAAVAQQFTQGNITTTNNPLDTAINGNGFFRVSNNGTIFYTRNGQFQLDKSGYIVTPQGYNVTGYSATSSGAIVTGTLANIQLSTSDLAPNATTSATVAVNLDSRASTISSAFNYTNAATYTSSTSLSLYDSLGNQQTFSMYYVKASSNTWNVYATLTNASGSTIDLSSGGSTALTTLSFTSGGAISSGGAASQAITAAQLGTGAAPLSVAFNFGGSTQFGSPFGVNAVTQDGFTSGRLTGFGIGSDGIIKARYTNGQSINRAQIVLTNFNNAQGLQPQGNNIFAETSTSGAPLTGAPATSNLGVLQSSSVEDSNVDLTAELVAMITAQRSYQANAQTIKTQDQVLQTLVNLR